MAEILGAGYQDLRDYIEANWIWIELRDDTNTPILRVDTSDPRVSWTHTPGDQVLELTIVVSGSDADITPPQTFRYSAIFKTGPTGGHLFSVEEFTPFTIETVDDQLTVRHQIEVPQVV